MRNPSSSCSIRSCTPALGPGLCMCRAFSGMSSSSGSHATPVRLASHTSLKAGGAGTISLCFKPQSAIDCINGTNVNPSSVNSYSVFLGTTGYSLREISLIASSSFSSFVKMRSLIGGQPLRSSENRNVFWRIRSQIRRGFHLPPSTLVVNSTGH